MKYAVSLLLLNSSELNHAISIFVGSFGFGKSAANRCDLLTSFMNFVDIQQIIELC